MTDTLPPTSPHSLKPIHIPSNAGTLLNLISIAGYKALTGDQQNEIKLVVEEEWKYTWAGRGLGAGLGVAIARYRRFRPLTAVIVLLTTGYVSGFIGSTFGLERSLRKQQEIVTNPETTMKLKRTIENQVNKHLGKSLLKNEIGLDELLETLQMSPQFVSVSLPKKDGFPTKPYAETSTLELIKELNALYVSRDVLAGCLLASSRAIPPREGATIRTLNQVSNGIGIGAAVLTGSTGVMLSRIYQLKGFRRFLPPVIASIVGVQVGFEIKGLAQDSLVEWFGSKDGLNPLERGQEILKDCLIDSVLTDLNSALGSPISTEEEKPKSRKTGGINKDKVVYM